MESEGREGTLSIRLDVLYPGMLSDSKSDESFSFYDVPPWSRVAA